MKKYILTFSLILASFSTFAATMQTNVPVCDQYIEILDKYRDRIPNSQTIGLDDKLTDFVAKVKQDPERGQSLCQKLLNNLPDEFKK